MHSVCLQKIKHKYHRLTSMHILYTHGLGEERYLQLISNPEKLIRELYSNESIPLRYRAVVQHRPDVNSAVNYIGQLLSLNVMKLRHELLQMWLQPQNRDSEMNDSITENFSLRPTNAEYSNAIDESLLR